MHQYQTIVKLHGVFSSSCGYVASSRHLHFRRVHRQDSPLIIMPFVRVGTPNCVNSAFPRRSDYTFILLTIFRRFPLSYCLAPILFIEYATSIILQIPFWERWIRCFINSQTNLNCSKSERLEVPIGNKLKCGIIFFTRSAKLLTSYFHVLSRLLKRIVPQLKNR